MGEVKLEQVEVLLQRLANQIEPQLPRGWGLLPLDGIVRRGRVLHTHHERRPRWHGRGAERVARARADGRLQQPYYASEPPSTSALLEALAAVLAAVASLERRIIALETRAQERLPGWYGGERSC